MDGNCYYNCYCYVLCFALLSLDVVLGNAGNTSNAMQYIQYYTVNLGILYFKNQSNK